MSAPRRQIPYWWCKICLESGHKLWLVNVVLLCIVFEWQTKDRRPQRSNVNAMNLLQNSQYLWNIFFFRRSIWVLLELFLEEHKTYMYHNQPGELSSQTNLPLAPHDYRVNSVNIELVISMEFLSLTCRGLFCKTSLVDRCKERQLYSQVTVTLSFHQFAFPRFCPLFLMIVNDLNIF